MKVESVQLIKYSVRLIYQPGGLLGSYTAILILLELADNLKKRKKKVERARIPKCIVLD